MKKLMLIYILLISLILTSCNVGSGGDVYEDNNNDIPREVKKWVEQYRYINVAATFPYKDKIYIMYANPSKEKDFTTEIASINEEDERFLIVLRDIEGEGIEGEWHYPYSLASISNNNKEIVFENESSGYVSTLFEVPQDLLLYVEPVFQNMYESFPDTNIILGKQEGNENIIEGIARVFEANVSYRVLDDQGKQIYQGFTTAASGGPGWGYFNIDISKFEAAYLVEVFTFSAKDGSVENLVSIHL